MMIVVKTAIAAPVVAQSKVVRISSIHQTQRE